MVNADRFIEQIGTPGPGNWKFEFRPVNKNEWVHQAPKNKWVRWSWDDHPITIVAIPVPKKNTVKALLAKDSNGDGYLFFRSIVYVGGDWNYSHPVCEFSSLLPFVEPGECRVVEVEVDAVAPALGE